MLESTFILWMRKWWRI